MEKRTKLEKRIEDVKGRVRKAGAKVAAEEEGLVVMMEGVQSQIEAGTAEER